MDNDYYISSFPLSSVTPRAIDYIWPGRLARGMISLWDGDPGSLKTTAAMDIAARITRGAGMPGQPGDGISDTLPRRGVVLMTAEDSLDQIVYPRMKVAGADLSRVGIVVKRTVDTPYGPLPSLPEDIEGIELRVAASAADLVVIDPVMSYLSGDLDSNSDQDVRAALAPLGAMCARQNCALIIIRHLNKNSSASSLYRGSGSIGITGIARFAMAVAKDPDDYTGETRLLSPVKVNVSKMPKSIRFRPVAVDGEDVPAIEWGEEVEIDADDLLAHKTTSERARLKDVMEWLRVEMERAGGHPIQSAVMDRGRKDGIANAEIRDAMSMLNIGIDRDYQDNVILRYRSTMTPLGVATRMEPRKAAALSTDLAVPDDMFSVD